MRTSFFIINLSIYIYVCVFVCVCKSDIQWHSFIYLRFWPCCTAYGIFVPQLGIEPRPLPVNCWTAREFHIYVCPYLHGMGWGKGGREREVEEGGRREAKGAVKRRERRVKIGKDPESSKEQTYFWPGCKTGPRNQDCTEPGQSWDSRLTPQSRARWTAKQSVPAGLYPLKLNKNQGTCAPLS